MVRVAAEAATLTQQLLSFSQQREWNPRLLDVNTVLTELEPTLRALFEDPPRLRFALAAEPLLVTVDEVAFRTMPSRRSGR